MAKKKKKSKKKRKAKKKQKKAVDPGPRPPTEKEKLVTKIANLKKKLDVVQFDFNNKTSSLQKLRKQNEELRSRKEMAVGYLQRILASKTDQCDKLLKDHQFVLDNTESAKRRTEDLKKDLQKKRDEQNSVYQQRKSELEDKLFLLEGKRIDRDRQIARLQELETRLARETEEADERNREEDISRITDLFEKADEAKEKTVALFSDAEEAFEVQLNALVKRNIDDNARYREIYRTAAEELLVRQDAYRKLQKQKKSLKQEQELRKRTRKQVKERYSLLLKKLESKERTINSNRENYPMEFLDEKDGEEIKAEIKTLSLAQCKEKDKRKDLVRISADQDDYSQMLEGQVRELRVRNSELVSVLAEAEELLQSSLDNKSAVQEGELDLATLNVSRMIYKEADKFIN